MVEFLKGFLVFVIIWWIVLFTILPIGVKSPKKIEKGHASGAPENPLILKKFVLTTIISYFIWLIFNLLIKNQYFSIQMIE